MAEPDEGAGGPIELDAEYFEAFEFLGSETRVDILLALGAHARHSPITAGEGLSFSDLRERVGVRDSGRFNYHLNKLTDTLVEEVDGTYRLTPAGIQAVATLVAGAFAAGEERGTTPVDVDCHECGADMVARYEAGVFMLECTADPGHGLQDLVPPGAAGQRSLEELVEVMRATSRHGLGLAAEGVCPLCRGPFSFSATPVDDSGGDEVQYVGRCERCPAVYVPYAEMVAATHPAVVGFLDRHGVDVRERHTWDLKAVCDLEREVTADPTRVTLTFGLDDEELTVTLDETATVVGVDRPGE